MNTIDIQRFVLKHIPSFSSWQYLQSWLNWFIWNGRCNAFFEDGQLVGMGAWRYVNQENIDNEYFNDPEAPIVWIDLFISTSPKVFKAFCKSLEIMIGNKPYIGFERGIRGEPKRFYKVERFKKYVIS